MKCKSAVKVICHELRTQRQRAYLNNYYANYYLQLWKQAENRSEKIKNKKLMDDHFFKWRIAYNMIRAYRESLKAVLES